MIEMESTAFLSKLSTFAYTCIMCSLFKVTCNELNSFLPCGFPIFRETMLDPTAVFALLFGSELFENYIGHLAVASMASSELAYEIDNPEKLHDKLKASMFRYLPFCHAFYVPL